MRFTTAQAFSGRLERSSTCVLLDQFAQLWTIRNAWDGAGGANFCRLKVESLASLGPAGATDNAASNAN